MEITYYFKNKNQEGKIHAEFGLRIPEWDMNLEKLKVVKTLNGHRFIAGPSYKFVDKEGKEQYKDYWRFGKETSRRFQEHVLKLVEEHEKLNPEFYSNKDNEEEPF